MNPLVERVERGFARLDDHSLLYLKGREARDLLQRISTNDLKGLDSGPVTTILTNEKGRIVDVITVISLSEQVLLVAGQSTDVSVPETWINRFIIMEDVVVERAGSDFSHFLLPGRSHSLRSDKRLQFIDAWGLHILVPPRPRSGAGGDVLHDFEEIGSTDLETYRIIKGIPRWGAELTENHNPLEAGLNSLISWTKGCYVGQEVIARLDTYKRVQQHLVTCVLSGSWMKLSRIYLGQIEVGGLTSIAQYDDKTYAIGYVRRIEETGYTVREGDRSVALRITRVHGNYSHQGK